MTVLKLLWCGLILPNHVTVSNKCLISKKIKVMVLFCRIYDNVE